MCDFSNSGLSSAANEATNVVGQAGAGRVTPPPLSPATGGRGQMEGCPPGRCPSPFPHAPSGYFGAWAASRWPRVSTCPLPPSAHAPRDAHPPPTQPLLPAPPSLPPGPLGRRRGLRSGGSRPPGCSGVERPGRRQPSRLPGATGSRPRREGKGGSDAEVSNPRGPGAGPRPELEGEETLRRGPSAAPTSLPPRESSDVRVRE